MTSRTRNRAAVNYKEHDLLSDQDLKRMEKDAFSDNADASSDGGGEEADDGEESSESEPSEPLIWRMAKRKRPAEKKAKPKSGSAQGHGTGHGHGNKVTKTTWRINGTYRGALTARVGRILPSQSPAGMQSAEDRKNQVCRIYCPHR